MAARAWARGEGAPMHEFAFEAAPEAFHGGVVVTVAPAAHARNGARLCQPLPVISTGVLHALIGVMEQSATRSALRERHVQCGQWQVVASEPPIAHPTQRRLHRSKIPAT